MKKLLTLLAFSSLAIVASRADVIFNEPFDYVNGPIIVVGTNLDGTTNWFHTGAGTPSDSIVNNHRLEISASSGTVPRTEDVHRNFTSFTNTQTIVYSSFTVRCTNLPPVGSSTYFAHFYVNSSTFHGRVFALAGSRSGFWRLGIAGVAGSANQVWPYDLAPNVDYQVVEQWDPTGFNAATLWVNPISSADLSVVTGDVVTAPAASTGYGFRQAGSFGSAFFSVSNLVVATTFDEAATNVWATNAVDPIITSFPGSRTNFPGESVSLVALAAGQGQAAIAYQWQKDGANFSNPDGNTNVLTFPSATESDSGNYRLIATTPYGLSVTSAEAFVWITNSPVKPIILSNLAASTNVFYHQSVALSVSVIGPPPLTYQWYYTNAPATGGNVSGADTATLTISDVFTNNGTAGAYYLVITDPYGSTTSTVCTVTAIGPPAVSVAFLRTLVDPTTYNATNQNLRWQATGVVSTFTNLTTGDTSSYFLQDSTAGINIFVTRGHDFRPNQGDIVTFIGLLSSFNSTLELYCDTNDPTTGFTVLSNNPAALPAPKVIPFSLTNNLAYMETNVEGSIVMLTNVFFPTNAIISTNANTFVTVTNAAGEPFTLFFSSVDQESWDQQLPSFAWSIIGPLNQNLGNAVTPRNQGYQVCVVRFSDIITNPPPAPVIESTTHAGNSTTIAWTAVPYNYSYSVLAATNVAGPYLALARGLTYKTSAATYTDTNSAGAQKFYQVVSP